MKTITLYSFLLVLVVVFAFGCKGNGAGPFKDVEMTLGDPILFKFPVKGLNVDVGGKYPINKIKGAYVEVVPTNAGVDFFVSIPLAGFKEDWSSVDTQKLPCGQPLPLAAGATALPAVGINVNNDKTKLTFYLGKEMFALFLPFNNKFPVQLTYAIKTGNSDLAYITAIPNLPNTQGCGGAFLNFPIPKALQKN